MMEGGHDDDPFGMFGDGDDNDVNWSDEEQGDDGPLHRSEAQKLINAAAVRGAGSATTTIRHDDDDSAAKQHHRPTQDASEVLPSDGHEPVSLPWRKPLYLCPQVRLSSMQSVGGGRGYVVHLEGREDGAALPAGTLVMVEEPLVEWPTEQLGRELGLISVRHLIQNVDVTSLHELEHLHPTKAAVDTFETMDPTHDDGRDSGGDDGGEFEEQVVRMMRYLSERHRGDHLVQDIVALAGQRCLVNSDGTAFGATDCLRLLLALRYNGLQSGVYLHVAMLNHSDQPNCVKFMPEGDTIGRNNGRNARSRLYSEVRTTRTVRHGEPLTIRYLPSVRSHATRRHELWEQHRFDIGEIVPASLLDMETVHGKVPKSFIDRRDESSVTIQVEKATDDLQQLYQDTKTSLPLMPAAIGTNEHQSTIEQIRLLEVASKELVASARDRLGNHRHVLLIPCLELHLDCANLVLQFDTTLQLSHRVKLLGRMVRTAMWLEDLQTTLHGPDHYDVARTHLDVAQSIEELLSRNPTTLYSLGQLAGEDSVTTAASYTQPALPSTFAAWSAREHRARKEYSRIKELYPRDVEKYIT